MSPNPSEQNRKKKGHSLLFKLLVSLILIAAISGIGYYSFGNSIIHTPSTAANGNKGLIAGVRLYSSYCTSCHGYAVQTLKNTAELEQMFSRTEPETGVHSFGNVLSKDEIKAVAEYVIVNQGPGSPGNLGLSSAASALYINNCAGCHGSRGDQLPDANLVSREFWQSRDVGEILLSLARGDKGMPAFSKARGGKLTENEIGELVRSLRELALADKNSKTTDDAQTAEAARLYANICATCHGPKGGLLARFDLSSKAFWDAAGQRNVVKSVMEGTGGMPPLGQSRGGPLTDNQAQAIIAFLKTKAIEGDKAPPPATQTPGPSSATAQPTPSQQSGGQKPQPAQAPLNSQHDKDWATNHARFVMANGAGDCYKCHDNKYCVNCHIQR